MHLQGFVSLYFWKKGNVNVKVLFRKHSWHRQASSLSQYQHDQKLHSEMTGPSHCYNGTYGTVNESGIFQERAEQLPFWSLLFN